MDDDNDDDIYNDNNDDNNDNNDDDNDSPPGINDSLSLNINAFRKGYNPSRRQLKRHKRGGGEEERIQRSQCCAGVQSSISPPGPGQEQEQERIK